MDRKEQVSGFTSIGVTVGVLLLVGIGLFAFTQVAPMDSTSSSLTEVTDTMANTETSAEISAPTPAVVVSNGEQDIEVAVVSDEPVSTQTSESGVFTEYSEDLLTNATTGNVLLFFHANWCPSCRALERNLLENQASIPADLTILKVDFDTATELKQRYGVVRQHTLVQVGADGTEIKTLTGLTNTLEQVVGQI